ncbi:hypothetical protein BC939DRAFT_456862, partial [Gamsiella multidivaricata]|uniref:uncharacterized protein n=1 Tax=Gamsiella multidivaricata TaxID=101098 RepID=UPI00221F21E5
KSTEGKDFGITIERRREGVRDVWTTSGCLERSGSGGRRGGSVQDGLDQILEGSDRVGLLLHCVLVLDLDNVDGLGQGRQMVRLLEMAGNGVGTGVNNGQEFAEMVHKCVRSGVRVLRMVLQGTKEIRLLLLQKLLVLGKFILGGHDWIGESAMSGTDLEEWDMCYGGDRQWTR